MSASAAVASPDHVRLPVVQRPTERGECINGARPCVWTRCRYHLASERSTGAVAVGSSCTLDVADRGGVTLEEIGRLYGVTRERIRQIEARALRKLATELHRRGLLTSAEAEAAIAAVRAVIRGAHL